MLGLELVTGKANEDDNTAGSAAASDTDAVDNGGDVNLTNIEANIMKVIPDGRIRVAYMDGIDANTSLRSDDNKLRMARLGVDGGLMENMLTYRLDFIQNMGEFKGAGLTGAGAATDLDYNGSAIDLGIGYNSPESDIGTFGLVLNYAIASGDDNVIDDKDDSFHDFNVVGVNTSDRLYGEILGKSNTLGTAAGLNKPLLQGLNTIDITGVAPSGATQGLGLEVLHLGASYKKEKYSARLDFYTAKTAEDSVTVAAGTVLPVQDDIGTEFDLVLGYDPTDNVAIEAGYAQLNPDDFLTGGGNNPDEAIRKYFARAKVKWGGEE
jgi:hypothetical protein